MRLRVTAVLCLLGGCHESGGGASTDTSGASTDASGTSTSSGSSAGATGLPATTGTSGAATGGSTTGATTGTDSTTGATTGSGGTTGSDSSDFVVPPDGGAPEPECDPLVQDCPVGEKCVACGGIPATPDTFICVPVDPDPLSLGSPCNKNRCLDNCDATSVCLGPDNVNGLCHPFCTGEWGNSTCEDPAATCLLSVQSNGYGVDCTLPCNPVQPACPAPSACREDTIGLIHCINQPVNSLVPYGEACGFPAETCAEGLLCVDGSVPGCSGRCCTAACDLTNPAPCPDAGQTCLPLNYMPQMRPTPGWEYLGYCGTG